MQKTNMIDPYPIARGVMTAHPIDVARGEGAVLWGSDGTRYIDFVGGIGVLNIGHCHPAVVEAVGKQVAELTHTAFQVATYAPYMQLASRLNKLVGGGEPYKSVFLTTGAEAVENAIKIARAHTQRSAVVAFSGGFHGRTLLGMSLTGMSEPYKQNFGPFAPDIYHVPFPDASLDCSAERSLAALQNLFDVDVAAVRVAAILIEPIQGDGGFRMAPASFMAALRNLCDEHGIVLICDEIQTGFGRTGSLFAFEQLGVQPDLITVAKSLAGGLPLSGVVGRAKIMDAPLPGGLGGTYGGNPVACAAALAVLDIMEQPTFLPRAQEVGRRLWAGFQQLKDGFNFVGDVRGLGPMVAISITDPGSGAADAAMTQKLLDAAREEGVLAIKCGVKRNVIRCLVPLVVSDAELDEAFDALTRAFQRVC
ncbi:4-aminobutyrate--2-oxoglutarate transaminase [Bordetella genomosp. 12]|uniref:4-aminobutyrate--2-oxoglutarate transaminase n=1 Tax=Bordetella genomosp. 12 TaxID=463035 RepID=A0A261VDH2_9BORD|nr:4-aminobutyrate--2-oxoglutarate transaminase [Bordetella genomosp. 12]OZI71602.1 4-aminobutyrate--2-oxoglutarate transaminase [Bordetella genomosp. 12]